MTDRPDPQPVDLPTPEVRPGRGGITRRAGYHASGSELLVPLLAEKLEKDGKGGILGNVLAGNTNMAVSMARTLLNTMPQEKKDELVVQLVTKNRDKLLQKGGELAAKNGVRLRLCDIAAKKL